MELNILGCEFYSFDYEIARFRADEFAADDVYNIFKLLVGSYVGLKRIFSGFKSRIFSLDAVVDKLSYNIACELKLVLAWVVICKKASQEVE